MKSICKSLLFFILAGVMAFPFVKITHLHFRVVAHRKLMQGAERGNHRLDSLNLPVAEFNRIRLDEREVIYEGRRYDIRTQRQDGDTVRLTAVHDWYEEYLLQEIVDLHQKGKQPDQQISRILVPDWIYQEILEAPEPPTGPRHDGFPEHKTRLLNHPWLMWFPPPEEMI